MHKIFKIILSIFLIFLLMIILYLLNLNKTYTDEDFNIIYVKSDTDFDQDQREDYLDFLIGGKKDAKNHPRYNGQYYTNGYPPENIGVCTDVIWRSFKEAGYSLRDMVDKDIKDFPQDYKNVKIRDKNIDFRRVKNLKVFFDKYAQVLSPDIDKIDEWQAGDIVIFENAKHIGLVSDKRNKKGHPYIIHNGGQLRREEDILQKSKILSHYRFDASLVDRDVLIRWNN